MNSNLKRITTAGIMGVAGATTWFVAEGLVKDVKFARAEDQVNLSREKLETLNDLSSAFKEVGRVIEPTVVNIQVTKVAESGVQIPDGPLRRFFRDRDGDSQPDFPQGGQFERGTGSGVIMEVDGDTAYIATNNHVAGDVREIVVFLADGRKITNAVVVGTDPKTDLAVVKIKAPRLIAAKWGDSDKMEKGDIICAFGSPFGYVGSMSHGIVSALNRNAGVINNQYAYENFIQVDAPINPGNSGGPLVNLRGEVIGINTAIASQSGGFQGIGFAIPSNQVKVVYDQLKNSGKVVRGWLGVQIGDVKNLSPEEISVAGLKSDAGVLVSGTLPNTPAIGKLRPGDVITKIDDKTVKDVNDLRQRIALLPPGKEVKFGIYRDSKEDAVTVTLGEQPGDTLVQAAAVEKEKKATDTLGISVDDADTDTLGLDAGTKGALIRSVQPNSLAAAAGLRPGEVVTRVGNKSVTSADEAITAIKSADFDKGVRLDLTSRSGERMVIVKRAK